MHQVEATTVAKECLLVAVKADPRAGPLWVNLANAYYVSGDHRSAKKCLEKVILSVLFKIIAEAWILVEVKAS